MGVHPCAPKVVQRQAHVASIPHYLCVQDEAERAELIFLAFAICLSQLTAATLEHRAREAMATFTSVDLDEHAGQPTIPSPAATRRASALARAVWELNTGRGVPPRSPPPT